MPRWLKASAVLLLPAVLIFVWLLSRGIDHDPQVETLWTFSKEDIGKARKILDQGSDASGEPLKTLALNERELNLAGNYLLNRFIKSSTQIGLHNESLSILATLTVPRTIFGSFINTRLILGFNADHRQPYLSEFKIGKLNVPPVLANFLIDNYIRYSALRNYYVLASNHIRDIELYADRIVILYHFNAATYQETRKLLSLDTSHAAMQVYRDKLIDIIETHDRNWRVSLAELLQPLFALAMQRSTPDSAIGENKALLFTVAAYVNNQKIPVILDSHTDTTTQHRHPVFAYKRIDIVQHFMASAAISAAGNSQFAAGAGAEKELSDAKKGGSGFSFIDLAADRAGLRLGEIAVRNAESARKLQQLMAGINDYRAFIPDVTDLPEHMDEQTFKSKFGSLESPETLQLIAQIDARIDRCQLFAAFKK